VTGAPRRLDLARIKVGSPIPRYQVQPSTVQLFRFSAITWNAHRIHFDAGYAREEGYPDVLVQSHLHGCILLNAVLACIGEDTSLRAFRWENRGIAVAGDTLTITGQVTAAHEDELYRDITIELEERNQRGELCAPGHVVVASPRR
jgi:hydroxyacyl-ACP dehydratase HTD2-like protein with hotdog domain